MYNGIRDALLGELLVVGRTGRVVLWFCAEEEGFMSKIDRMLQRAIGFVKAGREQEAQSLLRAILHEEPHHQRAWGVYVQSHADEEERIGAFDEYLRVFPGDQKAKNLQAAMIKQQNKRLKQLAHDAIQQIDRVKYGQVRKFKERERSFRRTRGFLTIICVLLVGAMCIGGVVTTSKVSGLSSRNEVLENQYALLDQAFQSLQGDYDSLQLSYSILNEEHKILVENYNTLSNEYNSLKSAYSWLERVAVTPPYILTNGRNVKLAFNDTKGSIIYWEVPFEALENDLQRGNSLRTKIEKNPSSYSLHLRNTNTNEIYSVVDFRPFVQTSYFKKVMNKLYKESESDHAFIKEVWNIVKQLTVYSSELKETPRYPLETLLAGGGDCEDTAILFASLLDAAPVDWEIELVYMDSDHPDRPLTINHAAVRVVTDQREYLIETTSKDEMEPFKANTIIWSLDIHE
jgi:hypothetical protein